MNHRRPVSPLRTIFLGIGAIIILACSGEGVDEGGPPFFYAFEPCIAMPDQFVTIYGSNFQDAKNTTTVEFNGTKATVLTYLQGYSGIRVKVPQGATSGPVKITTANGVTTSKEDFTVGFKQPVQETESNDTTPTANPMGPMTQAKGTLSVPTDKDHFKRECMIIFHRYKIKLTPKLVGTVYFGQQDPLTPLNLDVNGEAIITAPGNFVVVGLTGASGPYTLDIDYVGP